jgi:hypothetical protein
MTAALEYVKNTLPGLLQRDMEALFPMISRTVGGATKII